MALPNPVPYSKLTEKASNCDDGADITIADITDDVIVPANGGVWHTFEVGSAVGATCDVKVKTAAGNIRTFVGVPVGWSPPLKIVALYQTGTTATMVRVFA